MRTNTGRNVLLQSAAILLMSGGLAFAESGGLGNEDDPDLPRPGFVTNTDEGVSSEIQAEMLGENFSNEQTAAALMEWKLSDYQGATITAPTGEPIGTVEKVAYDNTGQAVYLIVTPEAEGQARVVPLQSVSYDAANQGLLLDTATVGAIDTMQPYDDTTASSYTVFESEQEFKDAFSFELEGSSDINSN
jgi:hypothetical protein